MMPKEESMMKKWIVIRLVFMMMVMLCMVTNSTVVDAKVKDKAIEKEKVIEQIELGCINVDVEKCPVEIRVAKDEKVSYQYDEDLYLVVELEDGADLTLSIKKKSKKTTKKVARGYTENIVKVFVPVGLFEQLVIVGVSASIAIEDLGMNMSILNKKGAVSFVSPTKSQLSLTYVSEGGSGSMRITEQSKEYNLTLVKEASSVSMTSEVSKKDQLKEDQVEEQERPQVSILLKKSSFAILEGE